MRLCKILLEIQRTTSHMVEVPRYEVAVRRAINPKGTKFRIHTRAVATLTEDCFVEFNNWKEAWAELRSRFGSIVTDVYDPVSFQDEYEATCERDGEGAVQNAANLLQSSWEPLAEIPGIDEAMAKELFADGIQSVQSVATVSLDELEAINGFSVVSAAKIQEAARTLSGYSDPVSEEPVTKDPLATYSVDEEPIAVKEPPAKKPNKGKKAKQSDIPPSPFDLPNDS